MQLDGAYIKPTNFLLRQMELLKNGSHSDFTVVVGNESIPVHKVLLAAGSPVFAGMFRHEGTKEVKEKKVVIPDARAEVVKDMLQFLYTGLKPKQSCLTAELLKLADQVNNVVVCFLHSIFDTISIVFNFRKNST